MPIMWPTYGVGVDRPRVPQNRAERRAADRANRTARRRRGR